MRLNIKDILKRLKKDKQLETSKKGLEPLSTTELFQREHSRLRRLSGRAGQGASLQEPNENICSVDPEGRLRYMPKPNDSETRHPRNVEKLLSHVNLITFELNDVEQELTEWFLQNLEIKPERSRDRYDRKLIDCVKQFKAGSITLANVKYIVDRLRARAVDVSFGYFPFTPKERAADPWYIIRRIGDLRVLVEATIKQHRVPDDNVFKRFQEVEMVAIGKFEFQLFKDKDVDDFCLEHRLLNIRILDNLGSAFYLEHLDGCDNSVVIGVSEDKDGSIRLFHWRGCVTRLHPRTLEFLDQTFTK